MENILDHFPEWVILSEKWKYRGISQPMVRAAIEQSDVQLLIQYTLLLLERHYSGIQHVSDCTDLQISPPTEHYTLPPGEEFHDYEAIELLGINQGYIRVNANYTLPILALMSRNPLLIEYTRLMRSRSTWTADDFLSAWLESPLHFFLAKDIELLYNQLDGADLVRLPCAWAIARCFTAPSGASSQSDDHHEIYPPTFTDSQDYLFLWMLPLRSHLGDLLDKTQLRGIFTDFVHEFVFDLLRTAIDLGIADLLAALITCQLYPFYHPAFHIDGEPHPTCEHPHATSLNDRLPDYRYVTLVCENKLFVSPSDLSSNTSSRRDTEATDVLTPEQLKYALCPPQEYLHTIVRAATTSYAKQYMYAEEIKRFQELETTTDDDDESRTTLLAHGPLSLEAYFSWQHIQLQHQKVFQTLMKLFGWQCWDYLFYYGVASLSAIHADNTTLKTIEEVMGGPVVSVDPYTFYQQRISTLKPYGTAPVKSTNSSNAVHQHDKVDQITWPEQVSTGWKYIHPHQWYLYYSQFKDHNEQSAWPHIDILHVMYQYNHMDAFTAHMQHYHVNLSAIPEFNNGIVLGYCFRHGHVSISTIRRLQKHKARLITNSNKVDNTNVFTEIGQSSSHIDILNAKQAYLLAFLSRNAARYNPQCPLQVFRDIILTWSSSCIITSSWYRQFPLQFYTHFWNRFYKSTGDHHQIFNCLGELSPITVKLIIQELCLTLLYESHYASLEVCHVPPLSMFTKDHPHEPSQPDDGGNANDDNDDDDNDTTIALRITNPAIPIIHRWVRLESKNATASTKQTGLHLFAFNDDIHTILHLLYNATDDNIDLHSHHIPLRIRASKRRPSVVRVDDDNQADESAHGTAATTPGTSKSILTKHLLTRLVEDDEVFEDLLRVLARTRNLSTLHWVMDSTEMSISPLSLNIYLMNIGFTATFHDYHDMLQMHDIILDTKIRSLDTMADSSLKGHATFSDALKALIARVVLPIRGLSLEYDPNLAIHVTNQPVLDHYTPHGSLGTDSASNRTENVNVISNCVNYQPTPLTDEPIVPHYVSLLPSISQDLLSDIQRHIDHEHAAMGIDSVRDQLLNCYPSILIDLQKKYQHNQPSQRGSTQDAAIMGADPSEMRVPSILQLYCEGLLYTRLFHKHTHVAEFNRTSVLSSTASSYTEVVEQVQFDDLLLMYQLSYLCHDSLLSTLLDFIFPYFPLSHEGFVKAIGVYSTQNTLWACLQRQSLVYLVLNRVNIHSNWYEQLLAQRYRIHLENMRCETQFEVGVDPHHAIIDFAHFGSLLKDMASLQSTVAPISRNPFLHVLSRQPQMRRTAVGRNNRFERFQAQPPPSSSSLIPETMAPLYLWLQLSWMSAHLSHTLSGYELALSHWNRRASRSIYPLESMAHYIGSWQVSDVIMAITTIVDDFPQPLLFYYLTKLPLASGAVSAHAMAQFMFHQTKKDVLRRSQTFESSGHPDNTDTGDGNGNGNGDHITTACDGQMSLEERIWQISLFNSNTPEIIQPIHYYFYNNRYVRHHVFMISHWVSLFSCSGGAYHPQLRRLLSVCDRYKTPLTHLILRNIQTKWLNNTTHDYALLLMIYNGISPSLDDPDHWLYHRDQFHTSYLSTGLPLLPIDVLLPSLSRGHQGGSASTTDVDQGCAPPSDTNGNRSDSGGDSDERLLPPTLHTFLSVVNHSTPPLVDMVFSRDISGRTILHHMIANSLQRESYDGKLYASQYLESFSNATPSHPPGHPVSDQVSMQEEQSSSSPSNNNHQPVADHSQLWKNDHRQFHLTNAYMPTLSSSVFAKHPVDFLSTGSGSSTSSGEQHGSYEIPALVAEDDLRADGDQGPTTTQTQDAIDGDSRSNTSDVRLPQQHNTYPSEAFVIQRLQSLEEESIIRYEEQAHQHHLHQLFNHNHYQQIIAWLQTQRESTRDETLSTRCSQLICHYQTITDHFDDYVKYYYQYAHDNRLPWVTVDGNMHSHLGCNYSQLLSLIRCMFHSLPDGISPSTT